MVRIPLLGLVLCGLALAQADTEPKPDNAPAKPAAAEPAPAPVAAPAAEPAKAPAQAPAPDGEEAAPTPKPERKHHEAAAEPQGDTDEPSEAPAPKASHAESARADPETLQAVQQLARRYFASLILGDARNLVMLSGMPFALENHQFTNPDDLFQEWLKALRDKRTDLLTLYGIDVYTPSEMEKKYGRPPSRLSNFPWHQSGTFIAVANLSGHPAIAVVQSTSKGLRVMGYTD